ncbi:SDR family oxidoreductase [Leucobacter sp. USHLN153]|uniref:SDR family oxidoreductase n=1 Tax=Leucobacter sp. USHLN153 TaxID=3081268 RepID=UPI003016C56D
MANSTWGNGELSAPTGAEGVLRAIPKPDGTKPRVLVLGATGYLGGRLVPRLLNAGYRARTLSRSAQRIRAYPWSDDIEVEVGDAGDADAVERAMSDVDVVVYLVHSMTGGQDFAARDRAIAENVAAAARAAGVRRIVYLGGLHPSSGELSPHLASRAEVGEVLLRSGVPTLVLQAGVVIGSGSASFEMVRHLTEVLPYMPAPKWVRNFIQPIAVRDVLHYLLAAVRVEGEVNRSFDIGGPDVLRYGQMMNGYAVEAGLPQRRIASLPVLTPKLASLWVSLVTPVPASIARPLVESLQYPCIVQNRDVDKVLPRPEGGLTPYREAVRLALGRIELDAIETSWVDARVAAPSEPLPSDPDWAGRTVFTDERERESSALPDAVWSVITQIGGETGWYSSPRLWALRGWYDRVTGGVGLRRGRRSRSRLLVGDALDVWRVEAIEPGKLLRLRAEMRVPGLAWLEFSVEPGPNGSGSHYRQRAVFFPRGLAGRLYWLSLLPFHGFIFSGMQSRILELAETGAAVAEPRGHPAAPAGGGEKHARGRADSSSQNTLTS